MGVKAIAALDGKGESVKCRDPECAGHEVHPPDQLVLMMEGMLEEDVPEGLREGLELAISLGTAIRAKEFFFPTILGEWYDSAVERCN